MTVLPRIVRERLEHGGIGTTLAVGSAAAMVVRVVGAGLGFAVQVVLARFLGVVEYGVFSYAIAWLTILALLSRLGWESTLIRFLAKYRVHDRWSEMRGILRVSDLTVSAASLMLAAAASAVVWVLRGRLGVTEAGALWLAMVALPPVALLGLRRSSLRGLKRVVLAFLPEQVLRPVILGVGAWAAYRASDNMLDAPQALLVYLAMTLVLLSVASVWRRRSLPPEVKTSPPVFHTRQWLRVALPLLLLVGMQLITSQTDIIMLGALLGSAEVGIYVPATRVAVLASFGLYAANTIVAPMISELFGSGRMDELQRLVRLTTRGVTAFTVPVALGLLLTGRWILELFGPEFGVGYVALVILMAGQIVQASAGPVGYLMTMTRYERQAAAILAVAAVANIVLNALLIPIWGRNGAAVATTTSLIFWNVAMLIFVKRQMGIRVTLLG
ncbi:MAG: flippase [Gemmatimonadota bacterium]